MLGWPTSARRRSSSTFILFAVTAFFAGTAAAHPLGNFTINHFSRIEVGSDEVRVRFVVDMAEIPAFQELQMIKADGDGAPSQSQLEAYLERVVAVYQNSIRLTIDGDPVQLKLLEKQISLPPGAGGLSTLRVECDFTTAALVHDFASGEHRLAFTDGNHLERLGWREVVVVPASGISVFNSSAFGNSVTDELKQYPSDMLAAPLNERTVELSFTRGAIPSGASRLLTRDGRPMAQTRDPLAELIAAPELTLSVALLSLLVAIALGAAHAFSPGHGKAVVGAYLVGSRGTPRHALFLGVTVTITHTLGVFALGLVTLFAAQYVVPERLFPVLSFVSGAIVVGIGLSLFVRRLRASLGLSVHTHAHDSTRASLPDHTHDDLQAHDHTHVGTADGGFVHSHEGGTPHSHLPPGSDGGRVTWRSLLALGISGGLLPCPSALVVMLSAIALGRAAFGLLLVLAFSIGLAGTLTGVGLAFLYAGRLLKRPMSSPIVTCVLPVLSALVITCLGVAICYEALTQAGTNLAALFAATEETNVGAYSVASALLLGLVFGLKHATEADHIVAISTVVSELRSLRRAAFVGGLWGIGHTASLVVVGFFVLALRVAIPERISNLLEFCVALMIIGLGVGVIVRALRHRADIHLHTHSHDGKAHAHIHFHEGDAEHVHQPDALAPPPHTHVTSRLGIKPVLIGALHGLAGSGALTVLVLTQLNSIWLGMLYLLVFGVGSIAGMLLLSGLIGLPFALSTRRLTGINYGLQVGAGIFSVAFGLWYAYGIGAANGILAFLL